MILILILIIIGFLIFVFCKETEKFAIPTSLQQLIPKHIFQTSEKKDVPNGMKEAMNSWLITNPDYDYYFFDGKECQNFIKDYFPGSVYEVYQNLIPGAFKADLWRYCILYIYGGVYVDSSMIDLIPLKEIIPSMATFISSVDGGYEGGIYNAFIACTPQHPIIKKTIELAMERASAHSYGPGCLWITGPVCLGDALNELLGNYPGTPFATGEISPKIVLYMRDNRDGSEIGKIYDGERCLIVTKYPTFKIERKLWTNIPGYGELWKNRKIYNDIENNKLLKRTLENEDNARYGSFDEILKLLTYRGTRVIVETGTTRGESWDLFQGDGGATYILADWASRNNAEIYSVDIDPNAFDKAAKLLSPYNIHKVVDDSLHFLSEFNKPIDMLYLDSYDFDKSNPLPSQVHHLKEIETALPLLSAQAIILLDDCDLKYGGKCRLVSDFLSNCGWKQIYNGYQKIFVRG